MTSKEHNNTTNFWSGFFIGGVLVFLVGFFLGTKKGREYLKKILEMTEDWEEKLDNLLKEIDKLESKKEVEKEIKTMKPYQIFGKGKNLIISWGSTKGAILESLKELKDFRFLQVSFLSPFPAKEIKREIERSKKVFLVENNISSPLAELISQKTGIFLKNKILKYDGRPFLAQEIIQKIKHG
jgi:2-oxoglutarate ferredoxin oxidoreductase subunit alpha